MLRGTNKRIIEISGEDSSCFERIVLFVRPEEKEDDQKMMKLAQDYADGLLKTQAPVSLLGVKTRVRPRLKKVVFVALGAVAAIGALALCIVLL